MTTQPFFNNLLITAQMEQIYTFLCSFALFIPDF